MWLLSTDTNYRETESGRLGNLRAIILQGHGQEWNPDQEDPESNAQPTAL
jgi:hypothetical protein